MKQTTRRGQQILEYIIVLTAIIAAIILAARYVIPPRVADYMNGAAQVIRNSAP